MEKRAPTGQYRTKPPNDALTPMVYVAGAGPASYITEAMYRAKGYKPDFHDLATEDEYDVQRAYAPGERRSA